MTTPIPPDEQNKATEILERRDAAGRPIYDQVRRDAYTGTWEARRHADHTRWDVV